ncbi:MAG: glycosyltransferase, partial [Thermoplasmata archaeon]|nr:glycosyltransferase [Thermoplasmata archaeon]
MRILHLSMDYPPRHAGGTTVHTHRLTHELAALGHEVSVVAASANGAPAVEDDGGVMVHRVPRPYTFFSARKARALMREV